MPARPEDTTVAAVLLVPHHLDPLKLTEDGPFGAKPPLMARGNGCGHAYHRRWKTLDDFEGHASCYMCGDPQLALVLFGEGAPVLAGLDRAWRAYTADTEESQRAIERVWPPVTESLVECLALAIQMCSHGLCTRVLLDAQGREVQS